MSAGTISRVSLAPLRKEDRTIHARLLNSVTSETLLSVDLAGMPSEAVDRTELFVADVRKSTGGTYQLQVYAEESISHDLLFSDTLEGLPADAYERIWHFFEKLEDRF